MLIIPTPKPYKYPETEAAQEVYGPVKDMQEHRDIQAAQLYRHGCKIEAERDALRADRAHLVETVRALTDLMNSGMLVNHPQACTERREHNAQVYGTAAAILAELG